MKTGNHPDKRGILDELFLGFDPGGNGNYGVALLAGPRASTATVQNIEEAINWTTEACGNSIPIAAGIDTLLHWATGNGGLRSADYLLKKTYPTVSKSIIAPNSLYGAMTLGGMGLSIQLRRKWPRVQLNETHPKVIFHALANRPYPRNGIVEAVEWVRQQANCVFDAPVKNDHELDAILSAWTTRRAISENWQDLSKLPSKHGNHIFPVDNVSYFWPKLSSQ